MKKSYETLKTLFWLVIIIFLIIFTVKLYIPNINKLLEDDLRPDSNASKSKRIERVE